MTGKKCVVCKIIGLLAGIGALNWGLVVLAHVDLVAKLLGDMTPAAKAVYILIGLAGLMTVVSTFLSCCPCQKGQCKPS